MTQIGLHNLKLGRAGRKRSKRVGRGNSSGRGSYSSRGVKGQKARSGGKHGLKRRGLAQMLKSKPKLGGFKSLKPKMTTVNLSQLNQAFEDGAKIEVKKVIKALNLDPSTSGLKVLGEGQITKKLHVSADGFSESAKQAILKAGGSAEVIVRVKKYNLRGKDKPALKK